MAAVTLVLVLFHPISRILPEQGIEACRLVGFREMRAGPEAHGEGCLKRRYGGSRLVDRVAVLGQQCGRGCYRRS